MILFYLGYAACHCYFDICIWHGVWGKERAATCMARRLFNEAIPLKLRTFLGAVLFHT